MCRRSQAIDAAAVGAAARDPVTMRETPEFQQLFQTIWGELQAKIAA